MNEAFPSAIPEIRVTNVSRAAVYYEKCLGFTWDWGIEEIGQVSRGNCRIFLTDAAFRGEALTWSPSVIWLNLGSKAEVDAPILPSDEAVEARRHVNGDARSHVRLRGRGAQAS